MLTNIFLGCTILFIAVFMILMLINEKRYYKIAAIMMFLALISVIASFVFVILKL